MIVQFVSQACICFFQRAYAYRIILTRKYLEGVASVDAEVFLVEVGQAFVSLFFLFFFSGYGAFFVRSGFFFRGGKVAIWGQLSGCYGYVIDFFKVVCVVGWYDFERRVVGGKLGFRYIVGILKFFVLRIGGVWCFVVLGIQFLG